MHHASEWVIVVLCDNDVTAPSFLFFESSTLDIFDTLVDWEWHPVARHCGIKNDVWVREISIHAVKGLH